MLHRLYISPSSCVDNHLTLLHNFAKGFLLSFFALWGGVFFTQQSLDSTTGTIRITATTRVPAGGLLTPLLLIGFWAGRTLQEIPIVDLSLDEEDIFPDTLRDEDFAWRLFGDLNHGLLGPPDDGMVTIISDSDEEEEAREEDVTDVNVALPSAVFFIIYLTI
jgi:hypothetical protein